MITYGKKSGYTAANERPCKAHGGTAGRCIPLTVLLAAGVFLLACKASAEGARNALSLCSSSLVPALFPFAVFSNLIAACGAAGIIAPLLRPAGYVLGISGEGCAALLLGLLCGFPVGARMTASLYSAGSVERKEAERLLPVSGLPSPAFVIGAVGERMLGSAKAGVLIYALSLLSAFSVSLLACGKREKKPVSAKSVQFCRRNTAKMLTTAVRDAALSMLYLSAFVVFFSSLCSVLTSYMPAGTPPAVSAALLAVLEIGSGCSAVSSLSGVPGAFVFALLGFAVTWSGLSVAFQISSSVEDAGIPMKRFYAEKAAAGLLCAALCALCFSLLKSVLF